MAMHVLQLGPYPPPVGGVSRNMLAIRDALLSEGHSCSIIATTKSTEKHDGPDVFHPGSALGLIKQIRALKFDILHLHVGGDLNLRVFGLALMCSVFGGKRTVLTVHSGAYPQSKAALSGRPSSFEGMVFRRFSRLIAVNEPIADAFRRYGVADEDIRIIAPYAPQEPDPEIEIPAELLSFCEQHSPLLLAVGGLEMDYDPLFQIAAMKEILAEYPSAGLMIVGGGSMRTEVSNAIAESGYSDNIFLAGNVEHDVTLHLIKDADVLLRTTLFDGDAISVREALHLGTPVIATDTGQRPKGVHLMSVRDLAGLRENLKKIFNSRVAIGLATDQGENNIADVLDIYKELINVK